MPSGGAYEPQKELGLAIRNLREQAGISKEVLGERAGLHYTQINRIENGEVDPTYGNVRHIARGLGTTLPALSEEAARVEGRPGLPPEVPPQKPTPAWLKRIRARRAKGS